MTRTFDIAVIGATGSVGEALVQLLEEREFPVANLHVIASGESAGSSVSYKGKNLRVKTWKPLISPACAWRSLQRVARSRRSTRCRPGRQVAR